MYKTYSQEDKMKPLSTKAGRIIIGETLPCSKSCLKDKKGFHQQEKKLMQSGDHHLEESSQRQTTIWGSFQAKTT